MFYSWLCQSLWLAYWKRLRSINNSLHIIIIIFKCLPSSPASMPPLTQLWSKLPWLEPPVAKKTLSGSLRPPFRKNLASLSLNSKKITETKNIWIAFCLCKKLFPKAKWKTPTRSWEIRSSQSEMLQNKYSWLSNRHQKFPKPAPNLETNPTSISTPPTKEIALPFTNSTFSIIEREDPWSPLFMFFQKSSSHINIPFPFQNPFRFWTLFGKFYQ